MTVIYIDSLFLLNLILNYLLLLVTAKVTGEGLRRVRFAFGAGLGALYAVALFLPGLGWLAHPLCKVGIGVLMSLIGFGKTQRFFRSVLVFFGVAAAFGGAIFALQLLGGGMPVRLVSGVLYAPIDLKVILLSAAACYCLLTLIFSRAAMHTTRRDLLPATLTLGDRTVRLTVLLDTGNTLTDPTRGGPVMVAEGARLSGILPGLSDLSDPIAAMQSLPDPRRFRLLPYHAVGVDCGMLLALRLDGAVVGTRDYGEILVALSPTPVSDGGAYQALIGA